MSGSRSTILAISAIFGIFFIINCSVYICNNEFNPLSSFRTYRDVYSEVHSDCNEELQRKRALSLLTSSNYVPFKSRPDTLVQSVEFLEVQIAYISYYGDCCDYLHVLDH